MNAIPIKRGGCDENIGEVSCADENHWQTQEEEHPFLIRPTFIYGHQDLVYINGHDGVHISCRRTKAF